MRQKYGKPVLECISVKKPEAFFRANGKCAPNSHKQFNYRLSNGPKLGFLHFRADFSAGVNEESFSFLSSILLCVMPNRTAAVADNGIIMGSWADKEITQ
jgi:hypothetical protein